MAYVITVALSVISTVLAFIVTSLLKEIRKLREKKKIDDQTRENALVEGMICLLRVKLIEYHDRYVVEGHIPSYAYENWSKMYKAYSTLGGNGLIVGMNEDIQELPIV
jgi:hypothetical protein